MIDLQNIDYDKATNILYGLGTVVVTLIGLIVKFRGAATSAPPALGASDEPSQPDFAATLLAERLVLIKERDKALTTAATAWREREKLSNRVAELQAQNQALKESLEATNKRVDALIRAINRMDPKLLAAFGDDFMPI